MRRPLKIETFADRIRAREQDIEAVWRGLWAEPEHTWGTLKCVRCGQRKPPAKIALDGRRCVACFDAMARLRKGAAVDAACMLFFDKAIGMIRAAAKRTGVTTRMDALDLADLFLLQDRRCALTGWQLTAAQGSGPAQATLARRDLTRGHSRGNSAWVAAIIAECASGCGLIELLRLTEAISKHREN